MGQPPKPADYLDFLEKVGASKRLLRSGWLREKVKNSESVVEHSFRVGVLAMVLSKPADEKLDKNKLIKMALLHDLAEVITGDIIVERWSILDLKKRDEKEQKEKENIVKFFNKIGEGEEYVAIFEEMILRNTQEAKFFWQLDKLEMALQAYEYEKEQGKNLGEFFETADLYIKNSLLRKIFEQILSTRKK